MRPKTGTHQFWLPCNEIFDKWLKYVPNMRHNLFNLSFSSASERRVFVIKLHEKIHNIEKKMIYGSFLPEIGDFLRFEVFGTPFADNSIAGVQVCKALHRAS